MSTYELLQLKAKELLDGLDSRVEDLVAENRSTLTALENVLSTLNETQSKVVDLEREIVNADQQNDLLNERLLEAQRQKAELEVVVTTLETRITELEYQLNLCQGNPAPEAPPVVNREYRESLVPLYGKYIPGTHEDAKKYKHINPYSIGIYDPTLAGLVPVEPVNNAIAFNSSTPAEMYEGRHFKGVVSIGASLSGRKLTFRNSHFSGVNPSILRQMHEAGQTIIAGRGSAVHNWTGAFVEFIDCTFDCTWWKEAGLSDIDAWLHSAAVAGGNFLMERCHLKGFTDGINFTGAPGNGDGKQHSEVYASRIGPMYFAYNIPAKYNPQDGGYTHSDGIQLCTGGNLKARWNFIGGARNPADKPTWPGGLKMGDCGNTPCMIQQEPDNRFPAEQIRVKNIDIRENWLAGGTSTINLNYSQGNPLSVEEGNRVEDNYILMRIPGFNEVPYYMRFREEMKTSVRGNVLWDPQGDIHGTGELVTAHRVRNLGDGKGDQQLGTFVVPA